MKYTLEQAAKALLPYATIKDRTVGFDLHAMPKSMIDLWETIHKTGAAPNLAEEILRLVAATESTPQE